MRRRPWVIATALALLGAAGATAVYIAGARISAADREAIIAWERAAIAVVEQPRVLLDRLTSLARDLPAPRARAGLRRALRAFVAGSDSLAHVQTPSIMQRARDELDLFLTQAAEAIGILPVADRPSASATEVFETMIDQALEQYRNARETLIRLRCRARLTECRNTMLTAQDLVS